MQKVKVLHKDGEKPIKFHVGGLHQSLGVAQGEKIPSSLIDAAKSGSKGEKAKKQAMFMQNVLKK